MRCLQHVGDHVVHGDRYVAQADNLRLAVTGDRFGDNTGRIGKIDDPGVRRYRFYGTRHFQHDRNGAQCLGEAADTGGLLPQALVFQTQAFIGSTGGQLPDPQLSQYKAGTANGRFQLEMYRHHHLLQPVALEHSFGQFGNDAHFLAAGLYIYQRQFG
ncbi:hypothetical protein D3C80_646420 [compost metagenome]